MIFGRILVSLRSKNECFCLKGKGQKVLTWMQKSFTMNERFFDRIKNVSSDHG